MKAGNMEEARECQDKINRMVSISKKYPNIFVVIKAVLDMEGFSMGGCRRPFKELPESARADMEMIYREFVEPFS